MNVATVAVLLVLHFHSLAFGLFSTERKITTGPFSLKAELLELMTSPFYFNKYQSFTQFGSYSCLQQFPANQTIYFLLKYIVSSYPVKSIKVLSSSLFESCSFFFLAKEIGEIGKKTVAAGQKWHGFSGKLYTLFLLRSVFIYRPKLIDANKKEPVHHIFVSRTCVWFRSRVDPIIFLFSVRRSKKFSLEELILFE